jgi:excisionase family DNA binding protein
METQVKNDFMTVDELIDWIRLGRTRTHALLRSGEIPSYKLGRRRVIRRQEVEAWLEEHRDEPGKV